MSNSDEEEALSEAARAAGDLYHLRDTYFPPNPDDRISKLQHASDLALQLLDSIPLDAWLCLGNCIWKKGDLSAAKNCLSLALNKGPNKKILCQLSMLKRRMSQGAENQAELVEESIQHAKEAITLDVKDGNSWFVTAAELDIVRTHVWDC